MAVFNKTVGGISQADTDGKDDSKQFYRQEKRKSAGDDHGGIDTERAKGKHKRGDECRGKPRHHHGLRQHEVERDRQGHERSHKGE